MQKIELLVVGGLKEDYWKKAEAEYLKRLSVFCDLKIVEIKDERKANGEILRQAQNDKKTILLDISGDLVKSEDIAEILKPGEPLQFIIGGSEGVSEEVKKVAKKRISFGRITLPHQMCRVVCLEQIYRGFCINSGKNYHK